jgi:hypothetical protein
MASDRGSPAPFVLAKTAQLGGSVEVPIVNYRQLGAHEYAHLIHRIVELRRQDVAVATIKYQLFESRLNVYYNTAVICAQMRKMVVARVISHLWQRAKLNPNDLAVRACLK